MQEGHEAMIRGKGFEIFLSSGFLMMKIMTAMYTIRRGGAYDRFNHVARGLSGVEIARRIVSR